MKIRLLILLSFCFSLSASATGILDTLPNPNKLFLGQSTDSRGLQSVGGSAPTFRPRNRYYSYTHRDTVAKVTWEWSGFTGKWNAYGDITQALPPVPITSSYPGYDRRTSKWVDSDDNNEHIYNYVLSAWVPADGIHVSASTPTDVSSGGSNGAAVYTKSFWYDSANSLLKKFNGSSWENIGSGGGGGSDSTAVLRSDINNLQVLSGRLDGSTHMGTYTGNTITDNQTVKQNIQQLETAVETKLTDGTGVVTSAKIADGTIALGDLSNAATISGNVNTSADTTSGNVQKFIFDTNDGAWAARNNGTTTQFSNASGQNVLFTNAVTSTGGTFTPNLASGTLFKHTVSSGSTLTIANATNNASGRFGNICRTVLKNSSGGSLTVSFGTNWLKQDWTQASDLTLASNDSISLDWKSEFKGGAYVLTAMSDLGGSGGGGTTIDTSFVDNDSVFIVVGTDTIFTGIAQSITPTGAGSNSLTTLISLKSKNYDDEFDIIPNDGDNQNDYEFNYMRPELPSGSLWLAQNGTVTYNSSLDEFGNNRADGFVSSTNSSNCRYLWQVNSSLFPALKSGAYRATYKMRAESGVDTIRYGVLGSETVVNLTTTWTEFTINFTYSTAGTTYLKIVSANNVDIINVRIGNVRLTKLGKSVSTKPSGHAYSWSGPDFLPTSHKNLLYKPEFYVIPQDTIFADTFCVAAVVRPRYEAVGTYGTILAARPNWSDLWFGVYLDSTFHIQVYGTGTAGTAVAVNTSSCLHKGRAYVIVVQKINNVVKGYINGSLVYQVGIGPTISIPEFTIGRLNSLASTFFPGYVEEINIYRGVADPALITNQLLASTALGKEVRTDKCIFSEGTSITASLSGASRLSTKKTKIVSASLAVGGSNFSNLLERKPTLIDAVKTAKKVFDKVIVTVEIGANIEVGMTAPVYYQKILSYAREMVNAGATVAWCTILPQNGNLGFETFRNELNALLRTAPTNIIAGVIDYDTTIMGTYSTAGNFTYYSDGVHPTLAGQQLMEPVYTAIVKSL